MVGSSCIVQIGSATRKYNTALRRKDIPLHNPPRCTPQLNALEILGPVITPPIVSITPNMEYKWLTSSGCTRDVAKERIAAEKPAPREYKIAATKTRIS
jgi:hypothetical protein